MKVVIFGASGVIGQHMRLGVPAGIETVWVRREADLLHRGLDLTDRIAQETFLEAEKPDVVINLAGESRPDVVEPAPLAFHRINALVPAQLAQWCFFHGAHYVHVSSQAVFSGTEPPYHPESRLGAVNEYGRQKSEAEWRIRHVEGGWTIVRTTFVIGVRPAPMIGRTNPVEQMLSPGVQRHANDRWFSVAFADEVAWHLWWIARSPVERRTLHLGAGRVTRFEIAKQLKPESDAYSVSHDDFPGIAPRPIDTSYVSAGDKAFDLGKGISRCVEDFHAREALGIEQRAREISLFTGTPAQTCLALLNRGFGILHGEVATDFRCLNPRTDCELLDWYRATEAYIWELSAYHADPGWNYSGMCRGIAECLQSRGMKRVLCLGDGIGDLTLSLCRAGFDAVYHDLAGSRTMDFARMRFEMYLNSQPEQQPSSGWNPVFEDESFDAIVSLDFLEHVTDVPAWTTEIFHSLKPGGLFIAQNAFAMGSGPDGSIPMHLARNDRFEKDWDPTLNALGFVQECSNRYRRPA
jgi:dTDP-4-dehydrorhamnose reductase